MKWRELAVGRKLRRRRLNLLRRENTRSRSRSDVMRNAVSGNFN